MELGNGLYNYMLLTKPYEILLPEAGSKITSTLLKSIRRKYHML